MKPGQPTQRSHGLVALDQRTRYGQGLPRGRTPQAGFSMITTLILLVIATLLGLASAQIVLMSERSGRYERDRQIAFQAAEAALLDAEFDLRDAAGSNSRSNRFSSKSTLGFIEGCGTSDTLRGLCLPSEIGTTPVWREIDFSDTSDDAPSVALGTFTGRNLAHDSEGVQPAQAPRYIIEAIDDPTPGIDLRSPRYIYRITAVGFGPRVETQVMLQMFFRKE
jgi:type IV pilus assembly protein PilX